MEALLHFAGLDHDRLLGTEAPTGIWDHFLGALAALRQREPDKLLLRRAELVYLANVILAGAELDDERFEPAQAAEAALATTALGLWLLTRRQPGAQQNPRPAELLASHQADVLFRIACHWLTHEAPPTKRPACGVVPSLQALEALQPSTRAPNTTIVRSTLVRDL